MKIYAALAIAAFVAGWTAQGWRKDSHINDLHAKHNEASQKAIAQVLSETERMQRAKDDALQQAQKDVQSNRAAAASASRERDRLRNELAASRSAFAEATRAALIEYTDTLGTVFDQCTAQYLEVARAADEHRTGQDTLYNAWPRGSK
jgi:septal ring factor EnvC (AmiA/AmiB activator)